MEDRNCLRLLFDWICFFLGYKKGLRNHDGVSLEENFGELPDNLQDYVEWVRKWIIQKKE